MPDRSTGYHCWRGKLRKRWKSSGRTPRVPPLFPQQYFSLNKLLTKLSPLTPPRSFFSKQLTFQRPERPTVKVSNAESTLNTEWPNTRLVRHLCTPKVREDMTESNPVTVVKPSQFSTRKLRPPRRSSWDLNVSPVRPSFNWLWRDVSTSNWVVTRSKRVLHYNSRCVCNSLIYYYNAFITANHSVIDSLPFEDQDQDQDADRNSRPQSQAENRVCPSTPSP